MLCVVSAQHHEAMLTCGPPPIQSQDVNTEASNTAMVLLLVGLSIKNLQDKNHEGVLFYIPVCLLTHFLQIFFVIDVQTMWITDMGGLFLEELPLTTLSFDQVSLAIRM
ncbi:hypothetical protein H671_6g15429 [Cricetulus griseus]|nr:hypothetical protein H671_6g15429 [Cricetulus griseus]